MRQLVFDKVAVGIIGLWLLQSSSDAWAPSRRRQEVHYRVTHPPLLLKAASLDRVSSDLMPPSHQEERQNWWEKENVRVFSVRSNSTTENLWRGLVPLLPQSKGLDVSLEFVDAHDGAVGMAQACFRSKAEDGDIVSSLEQSFIQFQHLVQEMCPTLPEIRVKARVVTTRGSPGIKCPRWHFDHVPVRWIQSIVGPGCDYVVGDKGVDRNALNNLDLANTPVNKVNSKMVRSNEAVVRQGREGEAIVLVGSGWDDDRRGVEACIHKSPDLHPLEGRVLLTLDVVMPHTEQQVEACAAIGVWFILSPQKTLETIKGL